MIRAFIAVELGVTLGQQLAQVQQRLKEQFASEPSGSVRVAWVKPASVHLTLKFLGDIEERRVDVLHEAIARATRETMPLHIPLARLGAFPKPQEPRSLWIGGPDAWEHGDEAKRLVALVRAIEDCCAAEGVPRESRPFTPHLTLARIKAGERQAGRALAATDILDRPLVLDPLPVNTLAFMKSQLNSDGAVHTRLWQIGLGPVS
jgi:RNA 2',3'-cyclic 3'-phosphodiesterase